MKWKHKYALPDLWFLIPKYRKRDDGRSGHKYVCPIIATWCMWRYRFKLRKTHWVGWRAHPNWKNTDDSYESAMVASYKYGLDWGCEVPVRAPNWLIRFEMWFWNRGRHFFNWRYWRWRITGDKK